MLLQRESSPVEPDDYKVADGTALRQMLKSTRDREFGLAVKLTRRHVSGGNWLDIGCSYGWFLQQIDAAGFRPFGIEPSPTAFGDASALFPGRVLNGEFPAILEKADSFPESYDVLSTMDVLEHIAEPTEFLDAVRARLAAGGVFVVKVPSNGGLLFRLFSAISSEKRNAALSRMWQVDFNYPHWHYYSPESIGSMLERHGFSVVAMRRLPFAFFSTANDRVRSYDGRQENPLIIAAKTVAAWSLVLASYMTRRFDNIIVVARKPSAPYPDVAATPATLKPYRGKL